MTNLQAKFHFTAMTPEQNNLLHYIEILAYCFKHDKALIVYICFAFFCITLFRRGHLPPTFIHTHTHTLLGPNYVKHQTSNASAHTHFLQEPPPRSSPPLFPEYGCNKPYYHLEPTPTHYPRSH